MNKKNIVIVGGGTAGWLTALYAKKVNNDDNIILIESEEYGILGAGEGSTPHLIDFLDFLNISTFELIKKCKATIKNGIKFTNWSSSKDHYYHPFNSTSIASNDYNFSLNPYLEKDVNFSHYYATKQNHKMSDYVFIEKISENYSVPFTFSQRQTKTNISEHFFQHSLWAIHFDANTLAQYLKEVAISRGIVRIEGIVENIEVDQNNYINKLQTKNKVIDCDFVFDCTGFRRLIIGKFYNSKWKSHSETLPAKKAIPFFLKPSDKLPAYTESTAMDYGWMWKIPLQHRYGCGYVFDSNFISEDEAKKELDMFYGFEVESPKTFSFDAGCYEKIWINNCLAVGLSAGFIEPLEASSIVQFINVLINFLPSKENLTTKNNIIKDKFNNTYLQQTQEIVDFLYLHYVTNKTNTKFWKNFTKNNKMPEFIEYILGVYKDKVLCDSYDFVNKHFFKSFGYTYVMIGNGIMDNIILKDNLLRLRIDKSQEYNFIINNQKNIVSNFINHKKFISYIHEN